MPTASERIRAARLEQIAHRWVGTACTLGGRAAKITRYSEDRMGLVATLDPSGPSAVFAWPTIERIMGLKGGAFHA